MMPLFGNRMSSALRETCRRFPDSVGTCELFMLRQRWSLLSVCEPHNLSPSNYLCFKSA